MDSEHARPTVDTEPPPGVLRRAIAASAIGNATEWFDYGIYAYGVTYISAAIFPGDTASATLLALMTFAVSFLVRPLGGLVWGPLGDRLGRKQVLAVTILLMSGATLCVGLVPSYATIGFWAPVLLVLLRMVQGFSTGGEYGGAATFMAEYAPCRRRGFLGSFLEFGTLSGFSFGALLMLGFSLLLGDDQMHAWGWRLPFLVAAPLGLVGVYLRSRLEDTPIFRELAEKGEKEEQTTTEFRDLIARYWGPILRLGGMVVALNVVNYTLLSYMPTYLEGGRPDRRPVAGRTDHRHADDDGVPALRRPAVGSHRAQADVVVLACRSLRRRRADVPADGRECGRRGDRLCRAGPALCAAAGDDLGDVPGDVPNPRALRRLRYRLQRVHIAVRWHRARGERMAHRQDRGWPDSGVLHDGRLRGRGDCSGQGPRNHPVPDERQGHTRDQGGSAAPGLRAPSRPGVERRAAGEEGYETTALTASAQITAASSISSAVTTSAGMKRTT